MSTRKKTLSSDPGPGREPDGTVHFGYRTVGEEEKEPLVRGVFDSVATKYDLMNDLMSGGVHRLWKRSLINWLDPRPAMSLLDVGGGTGDIAFRFLEHGGGHVTVCDINGEMLAVGRDRAIDQGILEGITWLEGNAEALPLEDASFDAYTTAFCIRNVTHMDRALAEARRVLRPGGHFMCLEFSPTCLPILSNLYDAYSFQVLPRLGAWVTGDREAYQYLAESIRRFPPPETFAAMIEAAGLEQVKVRLLAGGIAAIHSAWRI
ncbi:MAG: class I SAM-dependent methyltransferase [Rhodospirillales bacterium]|nr:class I SAM-dependent methyltransferase [Rhodospirillales bacterium]